MEEKVKSLQEKKTGDTTFVGIVLAKDWWKNWSYPVLPIDFVVCKWFDFHDGIRSHIEGKQTVAICKEKEDAVLIFNKTN